MLCHYKYRRRGKPRLVPEFLIRAPTEMEPGVPRQRLLPSVWISFLNFGPAWSPQISCFSAKGLQGMAPSFRGGTEAEF